VGRARDQSRKKVFVFLGHDDDAKRNASEDKKRHIGEPGGLGMSVKLPVSFEDALSRPFATPTAYGLGAKGWVTLSFVPGERVPIEELKRWIEESYRAVAPKKLVKQLDMDSRSKSR